MNSRQFASRAQTLIAVLGLAASLAAQTRRAAVPAKYNVFDVGTLGGTYSGFFNFDLANTNFTPSALNDRGELAGISLYAGDITAGSFVWRDGKLRVLPTLPNGNDFGGGSNALGINDWGLIIGISNDGQGLSPAQLFNHAVAWWDGQVLRLPDLGRDNSGANFVNNFGLAVGYANNTTPIRILFTALNTMRRLGWAEEYAI